MAKKKTEVAKLLTTKQALSLLAPHLEKRKKRIHTLQNSGFALMGCNIDFKDVKERLTKADNNGDICISGNNAQGSGHGVALYEDGKGWLFLKTDRQKLEAYLRWGTLK